jgi:hypothetical protein
MGERDALALDGVHAHRSGVQQRVDQVVVEEVHLVHVQDAAVGGSHEPRLEPAFTVLERVLHVECADKPVLGRGDRELYHPRAPGRAGKLSLGRAHPALVA